MPRPKSTVEAEAPKPEAVTEVQQIEKPKELTDVEKRQIERWSGNGMAYCATCVHLLQTRTDNTPICPIEKIGCDRNK